MRHQIIFGTSVVNNAPPSIKNPTITKQRMFYETMEEILPSLKVVINSSNGNVQTIMPLDSLIDINTSGTTSNQTTTNNQSTTNEQTQ